MFHLIVKRILWMFPTLLVISIISFLLIQLPPGDYLTAYISALEETGETVDADLVDALRQRYNLDDPIYVQYWRWMRGLLKGNFGMSFEWNRPVSELIFERLFFLAALSSKDGVQKKYDMLINNKQVPLRDLFKNLFQKINDAIV